MGGDFFERFDIILSEKIVKTIILAFRYKMRFEVFQNGFMASALPPLTLLTTTSLFQEATEDH